MTAIAIGLNHRSAPADVVGQMAIPVDLVPKTLGELLSSAYINEAVVLSTCNRTEIYVDGERFHDAYHDVRETLALITGVAAEVFVPHLTVEYHLEAARRLFTVAAGLDSAILGEHEILGQIRSAWDTASTERATGSVLNPLFQHAIISGKRVRTETAIGRHTASLSHAAVTLIGEHRASLSGSRVLLVGAGDVGTSLATAVAKAAEVELTVINRTRSRAEAIAATLSAKESSVVVADYETLPQAVGVADVVISATASPDLVVRAEHLETSSRTTGARLFVDLAMPADIDPAIGELDGCSLLTLEHLQEVANRGIELRQAEAVRARAIVSEVVIAYERTISNGEVDPLLRSLHQRGEELRVEQIQRYRGRLGSLDVDQLEAVEAMSKALVAKLLHPPSRELRNAAGSPRGDRLAEAARDLFGLS